MSKKYIFFKPQEREKNFIFSVAVMTMKMLFFVVLLIGIACTGLVVGIAKAWVDTCPELDVAAVTTTSQTSFIYYKDGTLLTEYTGSENRINVTYEELPQDLVNAVVTIEDARFWEHNGVDVKRIIGSLVNNLTGGDTQGASTITCQLVKQTLLSSDQTFKRKVQEAYLALQLEEVMTKEEILTAYMNEIYLGGSNYGVKVAALDYFGKDLSELNTRECAALARIIRNPYRYNPRTNYYKRNTPETIEDQTNYVLEEMYEHEYLDKDECDAAKAQRLVVMEESTSSSSTMYDHAYYVEYALYDVVTKMLREEQLEDNRTNRSAMEKKLRNGGYHIYTCLDPVMQQTVQNIVTDWNKYPSMRYSSDKQTQASLGGDEYITIVQPQAAAAVMDWHTGELLAIVGGRAEPVVKLQLNRAYQMDMPVGSSIKPLSVYGPAFDLGFSPGTPVLNLPIPISGWKGGNGYPNNFSSSGSWTGAESMRTAINKSHNYPTAQILVNYVTIETSVTYLLMLGVDEDHILANGSGLALGSSGLSVIELASSFGTIANMGEYLEPYAFSKVLNADGTVYIDINQAQETRQVFKQSTAWLLVDCLKGCVGSNGTGARANFDGMTVGGKTGTNSNYVGVTFAGITPYYSCAVWIGSDNYKPLESGATGGTYAAPLFAKIMSDVHKMTGCTTDKEIIDKSASQVGLIKCTVCGVSGMLPTAACKRDVNGYDCITDYYLSGEEPSEYCNMHRAVKLCAHTKRRATSSCPTSTYGVIYVPEGHPLRKAEDLSDIQEYFRGASYSEDYTSLSYCSKH